MKILLSYQNCEVGGVQTWMTALHDALVRRGHECEFFFFKGGELLETISQGRTVHVGRLADCMRLVDAKRFDVVNIVAEDWHHGIAAVRSLPSRPRLVVTSQGRLVPAWTSVTCDAVIACSHWDARRQQPVCDLPVRTVHNGVDTELFSPTRASSDAQGAPIVAWVGRGSDTEQKRIERLAAIAPALRRAGFRIWLAEPSGPDRIPADAARVLKALAEFWASVPRDRMPGFFNDVASSGGCVLSTAAFEGLPLSLLEAQACGAPVIGTDVRGINECVSPKHGGTLYPSDLPAERLSELVIATINDKDRMARRREQAVRWISANFSLDQMARGYERVYRDVSRDRRGVTLSGIRGAWFPRGGRAAYIEQCWPAGNAQYEASVELAREPGPAAAAAARAAIRTCPSLFVRPARLKHLAGVHLRRASTARIENAKQAAEVTDMAQPLVSVVIASHNYARFLPEAVGSVQSQTYPHWECIIIDDASRDDTPAVAARLMQSDSRIRYYRNEQNLGVSGTRNRGTALALGQYIGVLDADDWWHPGKLNSQVDILRRDPRVQICFSAYVRVDSDGHTVKRRPPEDFHWLEARLREDNLLLHSSVLMRRSAVEAVGGYDTTLPCAHDWDLYMNVLAMHGEQAFHYIDEPLAYYRMHGNSVSSRWREMLADERTIMWRNLLRRGWFLRHPLATLRVLDAQYEREIFESTRAGAGHRAWLCAFGMAGLAPLRRWRWKQVQRLFAEACLSPGRASA